MKTLAILFTVLAAHGGAIAQIYPSFIACWVQICTFPFLSHIWAYIPAKALAGIAFTGNLIGHASLLIFPQAFFPLLISNITSALISSAVIPLLLKIYPSRSQVMLGSVFAIRIVPSLIGLGNYLSPEVGNAAFAALLIISCFYSDPCLKTYYLTSNSYKFLDYLKEGRNMLAAGWFLLFYLLLSTNYNLALLIIFRQEQEAHILLYYALFPIISTLFILYKGTSSTVLFCLGQIICTSILYHYPYSQIPAALCSWGGLLNYVYMAGLISYKVWDPLFIGSSLAMLDAVACLISSFIPQEYMLYTLNALNYAEIGMGIVAAGIAKKYLGKI